MPEHRSFTKVDEFLARPREAAAGLERSYWIDRARAEPGYPALHAAHALFDYARQLDPDFPPARALDADLEELVELKQRLERISHALTLSRRP